MSRLVVTNIRLPKEDLLEYRLLALEMGMSFPALVRHIMREYAKAHKLARSKEVMQG